MRLDERQKAWIVTQYACYKRNSDVLREFTEKFGAVITKQQVAKYDCQGVKDDADAKARGVFKWMVLFRETRKRFDDSIVDVPIANKAWRIKMLDEMFAKQYAKGNIKTAAQLLEQAAKESGNAFSSSRHVSATIDGKIDVEHDVPEEVRDTIMAERLREAIRIALAEGHASAQQTIQ